MGYLVTDDGTEIFYNDWGTGTPVVLLHGWPVQSDMWEGQARFLAENGCRVIAYDRRGFGRSSQPWMGYDYDTLTDDLEAVLEETDVTGATLVGFSMGGGEVARYFGRRAGAALGSGAQAAVATTGSVPSGTTTVYSEGGSGGVGSAGQRQGTAARANKAVFVSAVTPYLMKTDNNPDGADPKIFAEIKEQLVKDRAHFLRGFTEKFFGGNLIHTPVSEEVIAWSMAMALEGSSRATLACVDAWSGTDFREDLKRIAVPTLFIHGTGDKTVPIDVSARRAVQMVPGATLLEYDGEPHGLTATAADRLAKDLLNFAGATGPNAKAAISDPGLA